jgi:hypothetical protein
MFRGCLLRVNGKGRGNLSPRKNAYFRHRHHAKLPIFRTMAAKFLPFLKKPARQPLFAVAAALDGPDGSLF